ncbi:MAG: LPS export ABC transporter permease LptG [Thermodesulfobacteriota bacterium]
MPILFRYIIKEILKGFAVVMAVVIVIYAAVDFFEKVDGFMNAGVPLSRMVSFFLFRTPFIIVQTMPVAVLLASLVVFGLMNRRNEVTALKSSGIGMGTLLKPAAAAGVGFGVLLFLISDAVVPDAISRANYIWLQQVRQKTSVVDKKNDIWIKDDQVIVHIRHYQPQNQRAFGLMLNWFDDGFHLIRRVDAARGIYAKGRWILGNVLDQRFDASGNFTLAEYNEKMKVDLDLLPEDLDRAVKSTAEMSFTELLDTIQQLERQGYGAVTYQVDLQAKLAFPFVCLIMSLFGASLGVLGKTRGGITANAAYGVGASFAYWIFHSFCVSLGYGEVLPPLIAAWSANLVFLSAAGALMLYARR